MCERIGRHVLAAACTLLLLLGSVEDAEAQGRGRGSHAPAAASVTAEVVLSVGDRERILEFFAASPRPDAEALPPGIRRNLERGKPLPPGIARRVPPPDLRAALSVPDRFELVEVGLDVLLVEAATGMIHDVLMDIVR